LEGAAAEYPACNIRWADSITQETCMEDDMNVRILRSAGTFAVTSLLASCAAWSDMDRSEKGTAVGATGGAIVGAVVGGPVGAAVGAGIGGYAGHHEGDKVIQSETGRETSTTTSSLVISAQWSLNDRGYAAGNIDGIWNPNTESAVRQFQLAQGLPPSGTLDQNTLSALGIDDPPRH